MNTKKVLSDTNNIHYQYNSLRERGRLLYGIILETNINEKVHKLVPSLWTYTLIASEGYASAGASSAGASEVVSSATLAASASACAAAAAAFLSATFLAIASLTFFSASRF